MSASTLEVELRGDVGGLTVDLALSAEAGPTVIVGPNGAGKTSLLMMILGALAPTGGRVAVDGMVVFDRARGLDLPVEQRGIGFLPQRDTLFPHLDVLENVAYGIAEVPRAERDRRALAALRELGAEALAARRTDGLSGGEAQRVALARALAPAPRALLLDEPLAALDVGLRREVRSFLAAHLRRLAIPTLVVTHDRADAEAFDAEIVVMERGAIAQRGRLADLAARPATDFVREFLDRG
ncbi:MAG TPA: ABC transporter ATP-binding protein [Polyangia bacterium]|nr:ABC transporter ATP-binding protein [Polyangia bacterium]